MADRPGRDHRQGQGVGAARPRRRRLPDRHEVELHAQGAQARQTQFPGHQRRRIRARSCKDREIIRHDPHKLIEGVADRRLRHARARRLHLHPRRIHPRNRGVTSARLPRLMKPGCWARTRADRATTSTCSSTAAPAPTSAAKRPRCSKASRARRASRGSSRRSRPARASTAARPRSTMSRASRSCRPSCGAAPNGSRASATRRTKAPSCSSCRATSTRPCVVEESMGDQLPRADRPPRRRHPRRLGQSARGDPRRIVGAAGPGRARSWTRRWISTG